MIATLLLLFLRVSYGVDEGVDDDVAVITLTTNDFDERTKTGIWMIKFYAVRRKRIEYRKVQLNTYNNHTAMVRTLQTLGTNIRDSGKGEPS